MPADLDLARELAAHTRCPATLRYDPDRCDVLVSHQGVVHARLPSGARVVDCAGRDAADYEWLPDLTDAATAGVLLGLLGSALLGVYQGQREGGVVWAVRWRGDDDRIHATPYTDTLGEAAARAVLALWGPAAQGGAE